MYKISIFLFIIMLMSCGITTNIKYVDDVYYSIPRSYNQPQQGFYQNNLNIFTPHTHYSNGHHIYIVPRQNTVDTKKNIQQPRQFNLNTNKPKQSSAPIRKFEIKKNK